MKIIINLLFVLPGLYLNILETEKMLQFWDKKFSTCVAHPAQEVKFVPDVHPWRRTIQKEVDERRRRGTPVILNIIQPSAVHGRLEKMENAIESGIVRTACIFLQKNCRNV